MGSNLSLPAQDASGQGVSELIEQLTPDYVLARFRGGGADGVDLVLTVGADGLPPLRILA